MTDKELKRMSRAELLQMLLAQAEENEQLRIQAASLTEQLNQQKISCENAGSIAEAALKINNVFEAADQAAKQYLQSVQERMASQEKTCEELEQKSRSDADAIVAEAKQQAEVMAEEAKKNAESMAQDAQAKAEAITAEAEKTLETAKAEAAQCLEKAKIEAEEAISAAKAEAEALLTKAKADSDEYWTKANEQIHTLLKGQETLSALFQSAGRK